MREFNSQICTTREQSGLLLALGLKKETADMKYPYTREYYGGVLTEGTSSLPIIIDTEDDEVTEYDIPAWSLHRLMCLVFNSGSTYVELFEDDDAYETLIYNIEWRIKKGYFNKEYLV